MLYDVFICHAYEDKQSFVTELAQALVAEHVEVWYDDFSLRLGDSIRQSLDKGLRQSRFGVVIFSEAFFAKKWPQYELDGLAEREMRGRDRVILPVWHGVSHQDVLQFSPSLANRRAVSSSDGIVAVVKAVLDVVRPQQSPLVAARDFLLDWGVTPPVITDAYWLDVVSASNRAPATGMTVPEESIWGRWTFPLPDKGGGTKQWGERLAQTAMQLNWTDAAEELHISPLTPPEQVLDFIDSHPGLYETCETFPQHLAEYAPQLTIPGLGGTLAQVFDEPYNASLQECAQRRAEGSIFGSALTVNGLCPACDDMWSLRHPSFGDYRAPSVTSAYFMCNVMGGLPVSPYEHVIHAIWLISEASSWLPRNIHTCLIEGMTEWHVWPWGDFGLSRGGDWKSCGSLSKALSNASEGKPFKWTRGVTDDALKMFSAAIDTLGLNETPAELLERFQFHQFPEKYIEANRQRMKKRHRNKGSKQRKTDTDQQNKDYS